MSGDHVQVKTTISMIGERKDIARMLLKLANNMLDEDIPAEEIPQYSHTEGGGKVENLTVEYLPD